MIACPVRPDTESCIATSFGISIILSKYLNLSTEGRSDANQDVLADSNEGLVSKCFSYNNY